MNLTVTILIAFGIFLASCNSTKNYLEHKDKSNALPDAIKKLNKKGRDDNASSLIPKLYKTIQEEQLANIRSYQSLTDLSRWDKILGSYNELQDAYNSIMNSSKASKLPTPIDYTANIFETKHQAAEEHYTMGLSFVDKPGRDNAKKSYNAFKKTSKYVEGYKNAQLKMNEAYENAVVVVVVNPVQDDSYFSNTGWGNNGNIYSNEYFQQQLVKESSYNDGRYAAKFYTESEARRSNVKPHWIVDLQLKNIDIPQPHRSTSQYTITKQVVIGRDSLGQAIYEKAYGTITVVRMSFTARADMEVIIRDLDKGQNISYNTYPANYRWEQQSADFSGDSRALGSYEENLLRNANSPYSLPRKEDILEELYKKIYPQVKNSISYAVDW